MHLVVRDLQPLSNNTCISIRSVQVFLLCMPTPSQIIHPDHADLLILRSISIPFKRLRPVVPLSEAKLNALRFVRMSSFCTCRIVLTYMRLSSCNKLLLVRDHLNFACLPDGMLTPNDLNLVDCINSIRHKYAILCVSSALVPHTHTTICGH